MSTKPRILMSWQFCTLVFRKERKSFLSCDRLSTYRNFLREKYDVEVAWDHDEVNMLYGFYGPIFKSDERKNGIKCNLRKLDKLGHIAMENGSYVPKTDELQLEIDK